MREQPAVAVLDPCANRRGLVSAQLDAANWGRLTVRGRPAPECFQQFVNIDLGSDSLQLSSDLLGEGRDGDAWDLTGPQPVKTNGRVPYALSVAATFP